jgi:hypothetical protein
MWNLDFKKRHESIRGTIWKEESSERVGGQERITG